jgi:methylenetetrahydrofolate--tRNA-(uracil-5-)-methyltransferase
LDRLTELIVIGGGLAGSEAAWQAAERGVRVVLYEMRPTQSTGAHQTDQLAELVCSNSLGSNIIDRASGLLKEELRRMGSMLLKCAEASAVPAGGALAVDRAAFSDAVTQTLAAHPGIRIVREEVTDIPDQPVIIASGPLTSDRLSQALERLAGRASLFFYDAIAPIVTLESIDQSIAFRASRYDFNDQDQGDYINCPFDKEQYTAFVDALQNAERIQLRTFENEIQEGVRAGASRFFEGCLPVEVLSNRDPLALAFGPMRPVGLRDPHTGRRPHAVVQLRQDNLAGNLYNLVGFQTNLTFPEQRRVFRMIPGLEQAEFVRYGQMHRNTFLASPLLLKPTLQHHQRDDLLFAGQITGAEGYMGNIATGLLAGINAAHFLNGREPVELPQTTMLGALCHYVTHASMDDFQPMKANFGILPEPDPGLRGKRARAAWHVERSLQDLAPVLDHLKSGLTVV